MKWVRLFTPMNPNELWNTQMILSMFIIDTLNEFYVTTCYTNEISTTCRFFTDWAISCDGKLLEFFKLKFDSKIVCVIMSWWELWSFVLVQHNFKKKRHIDSFPLEKDFSFNIFICELARSTSSYYQMTIIIKVHCIHLLNYTKHIPNINNTRHL